MRDAAGPAVLRQPVDGISGPAVVADPPPAIELVDVTKSYPGVQALDGVSLQVQPGEVHALVGENGAGKSTLIKAATGAISPDRGHIRIAGQLISRPTRRRLHELGVRAVFQERHVAPDLSVAENVLLDDLPCRAGMVRRAAMRSEAVRRLSGLGVTLDPRAAVRTLSVAELQLIEIARSATPDARFLVLDEPTASLHRHEIERLFAVIRSLRRSGVAVLFISHHLDEVFTIADRLTVLRDGRHVASGPVDEFSPGSLVRHMFGGDVADIDRRPRAAGGDVTLWARGVGVGFRLRDVDVDVRRGEVLAIAGAMGSGTSELAAVLAGAAVPSKGRVELASYGPLTSRRRAARHVGYVPADRKRRGLMLDRSVADNLLVGALATTAPAIVRRSWLRSWAAGVADRAGVRSGAVDTTVRDLSGGNQQKVVIGRWLDTGSEVLVLDEPTAGIDVSAKFEIYRALRQLASTGVAVVVCTTDFQEVSQVADRCVLLRRGMVCAELGAEEADEHRLVELEISA